MHAEVGGARFSWGRLLLLGIDARGVRPEGRGGREPVLSGGAESLLLDLAREQDRVRQQAQNISRYVAAVGGERSEHDRVAPADERDRSVDPLAQVHALGVKGERIGEERWRAGGILELLDDRAALVGIRKAREECGVEQFRRVPRRQPQNLLLVGRRVAGVGDGPGTKPGAMAEACELRRAEKALLVFEIPARARAWPPRE